MSHLVVISSPSSSLEPGSNQAAVDRLFLLVYSIFIAETMLIHIQTTPIIHEYHC